MTRKIARYGYRPDLGDIRDYAYTRTGAPQPKSVDLRSKFPPCWDQGQLGSCTAFALTGAMAFLHNGFEGSQLWLYYQERKVEGDIKTDGGAEIRDGIKILASLGLPPEADWPYVPSKFAKAPPAKATADAKTDLIKTYQRLNGPADYMDCLASGSPFVVGITVYESFESDAVAQTGKVPMPGKSEKTVGGHAICVVGYTSDGHYIVRNSWNTDWGDNGYFYLPAAYLASADLATDAWVIKA
jgi:C1A family cysteine protease